MRRRPSETSAIACLAYVLLLAGGALACGLHAPEVPNAKGSGPAAQESRAVRPLALWVPCEGSVRVLEHPERVDELLAMARRLGVTDLFVQVYRGGRAWYDAALADAAPWRAASAGGRDPFGALITAAHAEGIRVHAWGNVLSLGSHRDGPLLAKLGPGAVQSDREGRSLLTYPKLQVPEKDLRFFRLGTPAVWLDPGAPGVAAALADVFRELVSRHPTLDGLHLDYIRYPDVLPFSPGARFDVGLDFGFGAATRARFREETGLEAPFAADSRNAEAFDAWRRAQVTNVVRAIGEAARASRPGLTLSAAVWGYPDRAYLSLHQDGTHWVEKDLLSFAVPMVYARDARLFTLLARSNAALAGPRVWLGQGTWLFANDPPGAVAQLREIRALAVGGTALFSFDALTESPALVDALAQEQARAAAE